MKESSEAPRGERIRWFDRDPWSWLRRRFPAYRVGVVAIVPFGIALRLNGVLFGETIGLWLDEAYWANRVLDESLMRLAVVRPIGFLVVSHYFISWFGPSEWWLRIVPLVGGIGALLLVPYVARRLFRSRWLALLVLFAFAAHPAAIDLAKEFKPYSAELFIHLVPLALFLHYRESRRRYVLYLLLAFLPVAILFAYNLVMLLPGLLLVVIWRAFRDARPRVVAALPLLLAATLASGACLGCMLQLHSMREARSGSGGGAAYWSRKYDVFYTRKHSEGTRAEWTARKVADVMAIPGVRRERWQPPRGLSEAKLDRLRAGERLLWVGLHLLGSILLVHRRRFEEALLVASPFWVMVVLNALGKWPMGSFRTNLFLVSYTLFMAAWGLELLAGTARARRLLVGACAALVIGAATFGFGFDWHRTKETWSRGTEFPRLVARLRELREETLEAKPRAPRETIIAETYSVHCYRFYLGKHPQIAPEHGEFFAKNFVLQAALGNESDLRRQIARRVKKSPRPFWVLVTKRSHMEPARKSAQKFGRILREEPIGPDHLLLEVARKR